MALDSVLPRVTKTLRVTTANLVVQVNVESECREGSIELIRSCRVIDDERARPAMEEDDGGGFAANRRKIVYVRDARAGGKAPVLNGPGTSITYDCRGTQESQGEDKKSKTHTSPFDH